MSELWLDIDRNRNTEHLLQDLCAHAERERCILIVPEQFSHAAERMLCTLGGNRISRNAEVLSFSRLADRVFSEWGGIADTETDKGGKLLMMSLAVETVRSRLKIYANCAYKPEFLLKLIDTLDEFRSYCITAEALRRISHTLSGVLAVKTEEFALLMDSFDSVAANLGQNPETKLNRLLAALEESEWAVGKRFYFDGFTDFNGVEIEIITQLLASGVNVTIALLCDDVQHGRQQFAAARRTARRLLSCAQRVEVPMQVCAADSAGETALSHLRDKLFGGGAMTFTDDVEQLHFISAPDSDTECRIAVGELLRLLDEGVRPRDVAFVCSDPAYTPILRSLFERAKIPAYYAGDRDILSHPVTHFLLASLEAAQTFETAPMLEVLKSGYLSLSEDAADRLENYILLWGICGEKWNEPWSMSPSGYRKAYAADEKAEAALLQQLNADKSILTIPIAQLRSSLRAAKNTGEMTLALNEFMEQVSLRETLSSRAKDFSAHGELQRAQEYAQIYGIVCRILEQLYGVLGRSVRSPEDYSRIFRTALSCYSIGTIPASLDCVSVGGLMNQRRVNTRVVFLLGANEGSFPTASGNPTLLTDSERTELMRAGVSVDPTDAERLELELAAIDSVLAAPCERFYFSASADGSYFWRRARKLFPNAPLCSDTDALICRCEAEYLDYLVRNHVRRDRIPPDHSALAALSEQLHNAAKYDIGSLSPQTVTALYGQTLRLSSSRIDKLAECRFAYFLSYGLKAEERQQAEMDPSLYGTFVHGILEHTGKEVMRRGGFHAVARDETLSIARRCMEQSACTELTELWDSPRAAFFFRRCFDEILTVVGDLYDELHASQFVPSWFELHFVDGQTLPAVRFVGEKATAKLTGFVDRVDVWPSENGFYVRVIDYKTGKKDFDYSKIFVGLGLQMLLYLFALEESGEQLFGTAPRAAGVLYFPARVERIAIPERYDDGKLEQLRSEKQRRQGLVLNDYGVLQAMDPCDSEPKYLPYSSKKGERKGDLADRRQLELLRNHVLQTVSRLADALYEGEVAPNPYFFNGMDNACTWCPFGSVCRNTAEKRRISKLSRDEFWERLEELQNG